MERDPVQGGDRIGRLAGQRLLEGTQKRLDFLPERHTDFIFRFSARNSGSSAC